MASTYTPLGIELQATGENAGTWGTKTNTNLQIIEQISGGFTQQAVSDSGDTDLSVSDGSTGATLSHRMIEFTGSHTNRCTNFLFFKKFNKWIAKRSFQICFWIRRFCNSWTCIY